MIPVIDYQSFFFFFFHAGGNSGKDHSAVEVDLMQPINPEVSETAHRYSYILPRLYYILL